MLVSQPDKTLEATNIKHIFAKSMERFGPFADGTTFAIAVSGGIDSMALTLLTNEWANQYGYNIIALTVDHGLRNESVKEVTQVKQWLEPKNIETHIFHWDGSDAKGNTQAQARIARYDLMTEFCKAQKIDYLLVAHNLEDQAETVLLRVMRGSGVDGLSGISEQTKINGINIIRPLLNISRSDLEQSLIEQKQDWVEDPSNQDTKYSRVNVRKFLENAKDKELLVSRLANTARHLARSRDYIEHSINTHMSNMVDMKEEGYCYIDTKKFIELHEEAGLRVLAKILTFISGQYYKPRFDNLDRLYHQIRQENFEGATLWGCSIQPRRTLGKIMFLRELAAVEAPKILENSCVWDNRFVCEIKENKGLPLTIGALGKEGYELLVAAHPEFSNHIVPKQVIYTLPTLRNLENILSTPHINYYSDGSLENNFCCKSVK